MTNRVRKGLMVAAALVLVALAFGGKIYLQISRGEPIFWLAELWAPSAALSMGLVTCIEFFLPPPAEAQAAVPAKKSGPTRRKRL